MLHIPLLLLSSIITHTPYQNGDIGLLIDLPEGALVIATSKNPPFCMISSGKPSNPWHLRLERGANPSAETPESLLQLQTLGYDSDAPIIIENKRLQAIDAEGWLLVHQHIGINHALGVRAFFAIAAPGEQFIIATVRINGEGWSRNSGMFIKTMQSMVALNVVELVSEKLQGLDAATKILNALNKETLESLIGFEEWRRIRSVVDIGSPQLDIGYAFIRVEAGNIEQVEIRTDQEELEPNGIIVTVRSRLMPNPNTRVVTDTYARYWMSWDGKEERWSNRVTRWMDKVNATESETGIRNRPEIGSPKSRLMVLQQDLTADVIQVPFKSLAEDPWLPRALVWVLGPFLASSHHDANFIWMTYENTGERQRVETRSDRIKELPDGTRTISTKFGELRESLWTTVDEQGRLIKQVQNNNVTVTGSTREDLRAIWEPRDLW